MSTNTEAFESQFNKALKLEKRGLHHEALTEYLSLLNTGIHSGMLNGMIGGLILQEMKDPKKALPYLQKATELCPKSELASLNLFHAFFDLNESNNAFDEMKRFLSISESEEYTRLLHELNE